MTANQFLLEELVETLQTFLIENHPSWLKLNFSKIYNSSFQTDFKALQNYCNDIIAKHPNLIFESTDFNSLPEAALVSIIQREDLQLEESKIWDYMIQWGTAQNKILPSNLDDWIDKDFRILKNSLQQCLPHIRYFQISSGNIMEKVFPYQQILDKTLWADILKYFMAPDKPITSTILPPRKIVTTQLPNRGNAFQITSSIITNEHAAEIASWIDNKEVTYEVNNNPYEFNLILRGSRDGFERDKFWNLCDKKKNLLVVVKVKDTDEILGGYNPIGWNCFYSGWYSTTNDSFIFSLKNGNIKNHILSRVTKASNAIYNTSYGLNFGCYDFGMKEDHSFYVNSSFVYEKQIRKLSGTFSIDDYEVFQIKKK
ncbi:hypothetical protein Glove_259g18 [Diversispora epigaea]|uniref:TLDc domain-containing protein n=1 Tax=Diversispora epigaea TaxID=1348612 RepID=A0A397I6J1_9GLOM|nr:hypothetical protein Glove_259g18 [Diversispora epigaea]